jgi:hypothetical protein
MSNPFKIDKSYIVRHKILESLYNDWEENEQSERLVGSIKIATKLNISVGDVQIWQGHLVEKGEISSSDIDGQAMMSIQFSGRNAYTEKKYLKEGRKKLWDDINDRTRILIPLAALIVSIGSLIWTIRVNNNLSVRIKNIEDQLSKKK